MVAEGVAQGTAPPVHHVTGMAQPLHLLFMTPERWRQLDQILQAALERPTQERAAFLTEVCGEDEALRAEMESLLAMDAEALTFLQKPIAEVAVDFFSSGDEEERQGQQIGEYKLIRQVGAGGMGVV